MNANNTAPCNDGNACTTNDTCGGGTCVGGAPPNCNDGNVCTTDSCNPATGCANTNNTAPCSDGNSCTAPDVCSLGSCVSGPPVYSFGGFQQPVDNEPMVNIGTKKTKTLSDHWTQVTNDGRCSAHFEHTVAMTADGPWVLTAPPQPGAILSKPVIILPSAT